MKPAFFTIILFVFIYSAHAQTPALKIINQATGKEVIIKNKSRAKIKTIDGRKIRGKVFIQEDQVYFNNISVDLEDIEYIKKDPLLIYILSSAFLIYTGASTAGVAFILGVLVDSSAFLLAIPAGALFYIGLKAPNFNKKYNLDNNCTIEIISIPPKS